MERCDPDVPAALGCLHRSLAVRELVSANSDGSVIPWSSIADGSQDAWIIRRADAFKAFGSPIYLAFHHEPENDLSRFGSPQDYAAAFRHIVDVFRAEGVTNVAFVWNMMGWSFDSRSGVDVNAFYPGDDYVDFVAGDGYNHYPLSGNWVSFQQIFQPIYDFAVAHAKPLMVAEYGVMEDPSNPDRKGQWFRDALLTLQSWPQLKAMVYFDVYKDGHPCDHGQLDVVDGRVPRPGERHRHGSRAVPVSAAATSAQDGLLTNNLNMGPQGAPVVAGASMGHDAAFSSVTASEGASLTYDGTHARGAFSVEHRLLPHSDSYYEWDGTRTIWFGRVYVWLVARPPSNLRLIRAASDGTLSCSIDVMPNGVLQFNDSLNRAGRRHAFQGEVGPMGPDRVEGQQRPRHGRDEALQPRERALSRPTSYERARGSRSGRARTSSSSDDPGISRSP